MNAAQLPEVEFYRTQAGGNLVWVFIAHNLSRGKSLWPYVFIVVPLEMRMGR